MKRIIAINLLLMVSLSVLPTEKLPLKENQVEKEIQQVAYVEVTDRSLEEPRETKEEIIEEVTTYSEYLVAYIKQPNVEGFKEVAFIDKNDSDGLNQYTIGYGHHGSDVKSNQTISKDEADRLLRADLEGACEFVKKHCAYLGDLSQGELDALTDFTFNGGPSMLQKLTKNKTRTKEEIANHITSYTNGGLKGLVNRRNEELKMFKGEN